MSEEQEIEEQDAEQVFYDAVENETVVDDESTTEEQEYSPLEQEALDSGWTPKEQFVEKGGDAERWKTAHEYVEYGKLKNALNNAKADQDRMKSDFDKRLESVNKIHKAQQEAQLNAYKEEQRRAVEEADTAAYDEAQKKIDGMKNETPQEVPAKDPKIIEWENKNSWVNDIKDPRAQEANDLWNSYVNRNPNDSVDNALAYIDRVMGLNERETNPRREAPSDTSRQTTKTKTKSSLSFNDLTQEERDFYNQTKHDLWADAKHPNGNVKEYLKAVKDSRKG